MIRVALLAVSLLSLPGVSDNDIYSGPLGTRALWCSDAVGFVADCHVEHAYEWRSLDEADAGRRALRDSAIRCVTERVGSTDRGVRWQTAHDWCARAGGSFLVEWGRDGVAERATCEIGPEP